MTESTEIKKSEAFVAYLDILGFTNIAQSDNWEARVKNIMRVVKAAVSEAVDWEPVAIIPKTRPSSLVVSDSIIIWVTPDEAGNSFDNKAIALRYLLHMVEELQYQCAIEDIWLRGGVSFGEILTSDSNSPGYLRAYSLETKAEFPRVLVDAKMMRDIFGDSSTSKQLEMINRVDSQGFSQATLYEFPQPAYPKTHFKPDYPFFVHYLNRVKEPYKVVEFAKLWKNVRKNVYNSDPRIFQKHSWVAEYLEHYGERISPQNSFLHHMRQNPL